MGKSSPKPPAAPDPTATANAQTASNKETAMANATLNRIDQYTPYGSLTYTQNGTDSNGVPIYQSNINLTPQSQQMFNQQQQNQLGLGNAESTLADRIQVKMNSPQNLFYNAVTGQQMPGVQSSVTGGPIQNSLDFSNLSAIPSSMSDFNAQGQQAQNDILSRITPELDRQQAQLNTTLANQGIMPGSNAYNEAQKQFGQQVNDANTQAALQGYNLQNSLYGQALQSRQQLANEDMAQGQYTNGAQQLGFNEGLSNANLNNQAMNQNMQNIITARDLPINELNALSGQTQIQMPNFGPMQPVSMSNTDVMSPINNQYAAQQNAYNQKIASQNQTMGGLFSLGGSLGSAMLFSDKRLKKNIKKIGQTPAGIGVYEFNYIHNDIPQTGVMAQEVEKVIPAAVITGSDGYKMVNYALVR